MPDAIVFAPTEENNSCSWFQGLVARRRPLAFSQYSAHTAETFCLPCSTSLSILRVDTPNLLARLSIVVCGLSIVRGATTSASKTAASRPQLTAIERTEVGRQRIAKANYAEQLVVQGIGNRNGVRK